MAKARLSLGQTASCAACDIMLISVAAVAGKPDPEAFVSRSDTQMNRLDSGKADPDVALRGSSGFLK